ncbi:protein containing Cyclomaltodextrinase [human gut metagenome]|uniref:Protein containing Cyclomaltodextrinase n=1 Tax=human gut metagenome TaxID=408170 RepID=K1S2H5_9ZZZZ
MMYSVGFRPNFLPYKEKEAANPRLRVGMKDASLQLMVYGKDIKNADVTVDYPGVKVDSIARLDSPNYLLVYLNLDGAKAGEMTLNFKQGKQSKKVKYVLKNREMAGDKRHTVSLMKMCSIC